jgi:hypothetical protein
MFAHGYNKIKHWKSSLFFSCLLIISTVFCSCEKVIDIDLNTASKKYVIEGTVANKPNSCKVILTQTKDFDQGNSFEGVSGAVVTIAADGDNPVLLTETTPGVYESPELVGVPGRTYQLKVQVDGSQFSATSTMPQVVGFDSLFVTERSFFNEKSKYATVTYKDPPGVKNAYRFIQYVNGKKEKTIFVRDDDANDGLIIERTLVYFSNDDNDDDKLKSGDNLVIEMLGISQPVYKFWYSLAQSSTGENQSATPGNPVTNIQGGALGYFSAHTLQSRSIVVP